MDLAIEFITDSREASKTIELAVKMCTSAYACAEASDEILARHTRDWNLRRLALVDRNTLRLGVWELLTKHSPPKVAIVEAIRLAKEFSTAESPRFINGVLDAVAKDLSGEKPAKATPADAEPTADETTTEEPTADEPTAEDPQADSSDEPEDGVEKLP